MSSRLRLSLVALAAVVVVVLFAITLAPSPAPTYDGVKAELTTRAVAAAARADNARTRKLHSEITSQTAGLGVIEKQYVEAKLAGATDQQLDQLSVRYADTLAGVFSSIHELNKNVDFGEMASLEGLEFQLMNLDKQRFLSEGDEILGLFKPFHDFATPSTQAYEVIIPLKEKLLDAAGSRCSGAHGGASCSASEERAALIKGARIVLDAGMVHH